MSDPKLADGTGATRYAPMLGDIVAIDTRGLDPKLGLYGIRVGRVVGVLGDLTLVMLPGFDRRLDVALEHVELIRREVAP